MSGGALNRCGCFFTGICTGVTPHHHICNMQTDLLFSLPVTIGLCWKVESIATRLLCCCASSFHWRRNGGPLRPQHRRGGAFDREMPLVSLDSHKAPLKRLRHICDNPCSSYVSCQRSHMPLAMPTPCRRITPVPPTQRQ